MCEAVTIGRRAEPSRHTTARAMRSVPGIVEEAVMCLYALRPQRDNAARNADFTCFCHSNVL